MNTNPTRSLSEHITEALSNVTESSADVDKYLQTIANDYQLDKKSRDYTGFLNTTPRDQGKAAIEFINNVDKYKSLMKKHGLALSKGYDDEEAVFVLESSAAEAFSKSAEPRDIEIVAANTPQLSNSTKINTGDIMSADIMKDGKVVELSMYPDAKKKFYVSKEYAKANFIIESVNEAKMSKQETESFTIDYDNMGGGLNGRIDFQLWGADEIAIELGHYSGGRNIRFKMDSKSAQKLLDDKAKRRKMTADLKIGERIPDEQLAEYMALENELSIELTQNMALDLKNVASAYEKEIAKVLAKYGFKL